MVLAAGREWEWRFADSICRPRHPCGRGWSRVGDRTFEWEEKDIFAIPSWCPHSHGNGSSSEEAVLFSFNDFPAMRALALYREDAS